MRINLAGVRLMLTKMLCRWMWEGSDAEYEQLGEICDPRIHQIRRSLRWEFSICKQCRGPTVFTPNLVHAFFPRIVESSVRCSVATNGGIDTNALRDG